MLEQECDKILKFIYHNRLDKDKKGWLYHTFKTQFPEFDDALMEDLLCILFSDGFLENVFEEKEPPKNTNFRYFEITPKGIGFYNSDSYVDRAKRMKLEKDMKALEYKLKTKTFWIALTGLIVSIISLITSLFFSK